MENSRKEVIKRIVVECRARDVHATRDLASFLASTLRVNIEFLFNSNNH